MISFHFLETFENDSKFVSTNMEIGLFTILFLISNKTILDNARKKNISVFHFLDKREIHFLNTIALKVTWEQSLPLLACANSLPTVFNVLEFCP